MKLTPLVQVFDMIESARFYCELLGFELVEKSPEVETAEGRFSHWMWLRKDGVELMLNTAYDANERPASRELERWRGHGDIGFYIECADVDAVHASLVARGLAADSPQQMRYGMKSFTVRDPDGYAITFQTRS
jgi:glyoxylase I family protein